MSHYETIYALVSKPRLNQLLEFKQLHALILVERGHRDVLRCLYPQPNIHLSSFTRLIPPHPLRSQDDLNQALCYLAPTLCLEKDHPLHSTIQSLSFIDLDCNPSLLDPIDTSSLPFFQNKVWIQSNFTLLKSFFLD
jgi:hypothetical protein